MIITKSQLIAEWRLRKGLMPLPSDSVTVVESHFNSDSFIGLKVDDWYHHLLATAPESMLDPEDLADSDEVDLEADDGAITLTLPERCCRVLSVKLIEWSRPAIITTAETPLAAAQASPLTRGGRHQPVAVVEGRRVTLYSGTTPRPRLERLLVAAVPAAADVYRLDRSALATIGTFDTTDL